MNLTLRQFKALLNKNIKGRLRDWKSVILVLILPIVLLVAVNARHPGPPQIKERDSTDYPRDVLQYNVLSLIMPLVYVPACPALEKFFGTGRDYKHVPEVIGFKTWYSGHRYLNTTNNKRPLVMFDGMTPTSAEVPKHLRFRVLSPWHVDKDDLRGPSHDYTVKFISMTQFYIAHVFVNYWQTVNRLNRTTFLMRTYKMPNILKENRALWESYQLVALSVFLIFLTFSCHATRVIVKEKERQLKDSILPLGVPLAVYLTAWYIIHMFMVSFLIVGMMSGLAETWTYKSPIYICSKGLLFVVLMCAASNFLTFSLCVSIFIKKAEHVIPVLSVTLFICLSLSGVLRRDLLVSPLTTTQLYTFATILFGPAFNIIFDRISKNEYNGMETNFSNISEMDSEGKSILGGIISMNLNSLLNMAAVCYVDRASGGQFAIDSVLYFLQSMLQNFRSTTMKKLNNNNSSNERRTSRISVSSQVDTDLRHDSLMKTTRTSVTKRSSKDQSHGPGRKNRFIEVFEGGQEPAVQMTNLVKTYGSTVVLSDLNLDIPYNQITVLLGHTGTGKSTVFSILTGFLQQSDGTVMVDGYDVNKSLRKVRESIGFCRQRHFLFSKLTCLEHLILYSNLRGQYGEKIVADVKDVLVKMGLGKKKRSLPHKLTSGQKRKLAIACAFMGNVKIIFLDDPTGGTESSTRTEIWKFIKEMKDGRTIFLTSHLMEEADILGDRVAILADGKIHSYGTPSFLKKVYGTGYTLCLVKGEGFSTHLVSEIMWLYDAGESVSENHYEIEYNIAEHKANALTNVLTDVYNNKKELKITAYSIRAVTLEDVFIRLAKNIDVFNKELDEKSIRRWDFKSPSIGTDIDFNVSNDSSVVTSCTRTDFDALSMCDQIDGVPLFLQQMAAILTKKFILFKRSPVLSLLLLLLPPLLVLHGAWLDADASRARLYKPVYFSLDDFPETITLVVKDPWVPEKLLDAYVDQFRSDRHRFIKDFPQSPWNHSFHGDFIHEYAQRTTKINNDYDTKVIVGVHLKGPESPGTVVYYRDTAVFSQGIAVQLYLNAHVRYELGKDYSIQSGVHHLRERIGWVSWRFTSLYLRLLFAALPAVFIHGPISESATGAKHLQTLSGVNPLAYWLGTFLFDLAKLLFIVATMMLSLLCSSDVFLAENRWVIIMFITLTYSLTVLPFTYCLQLLFARPADGVAAVVTSNLIMGFIVVETMLRYRSIHIIKDINLLLTLLIPNYAFYSAFHRMVFIYAQEWENGFFLGYFETNPELANWFTAVTGHLCHLFLYWFVLLCYEMDIFRMMWYRLNSPCACLTNYLLRRANDVTYWFDSRLAEDDDVIKEREIIQKTALKVLQHRDAVLMIDLCKRYWINSDNVLTAVSGTNVGISHSECFAFLGPSRSGKTTTLRMLTGEATVSNGDIFVEGLNIKFNKKNVQSRIGYCPQQDALHPLLTGRETLILYARLRGVPMSQLKSATESIIKIVKLHPDEDKLTKNYSAGSKRKLSVGISIIGVTSFIILDDPTAGMDCESRRALWAVFHMIRKTGRTVILTSQSMEECNALCTRIAIMGRGNVLRLGSPQHLRHKYIHGYIVNIYAILREDGHLLSLAKVINFLQRNIDGIKILNEMGFYVQISSPDMPIHQLFGILQKASENYNFAHYTIQHTTMERFFYTIAKQS